MEGRLLALGQWMLQPAAPDGLLAEGRALGIPSHVVQVLYNRGLTDVSSITSFLSPEDSAEADPFLLRDMDVAVARVRKAIQSGERIAVYGDYDADGVTATAVLAEAIALLGGQVEAYIPHRTAEGYGLNREALCKLRESGVTLAVTVDCGVGSTLEVEYATSIGLDVVVTDRHDLHGDLPPAVAVINPKREDSDYPFRHLAGVGVAFRVAQALVSDIAGRDKVSNAARWLDLVAIGTVTDVVPLVGDNRSLVKRGLNVLRSTIRPGLRELVNVAGLPLASLDEGHIGYGLGPRINAAGRIDDALVAYQLLTTSSREEAQRLARVLEDRNALRQRMTESALARARELVPEQTGEAPVLVIEDVSFAPGLVGLIAAKLAEEYGRPAIVLERSDEFCRGSARSIPGFDIAAALARCSPLLERYGGHASAAGLLLRTERLGLLRKQACRNCRARAGRTGYRSQNAYRRGGPSLHCRLGAAAQSGKTGPLRGRQS